MATSDDHAGVFLLELDLDKHFFSVLDKSKPVKRVRKEQTRSSRAVDPLVGKSFYFDSGLVKSLADHFKKVVSAEHASILDDALKDEVKLSTDLS